MKNKTIRRIRNTVFAAVCGTAAVFAGQPPFPQQVVSYADTQTDLQQQIADADEKIKELEKKIADADTDIAANSEQQDAYWEYITETQNKIDLVNLSVSAKQEEIIAKEAEIADKEVEIEEAQLRIDETDREIGDTEQQIKMLEDQNALNLDRCADMIHAMVISSSDDYLSIIAGSSDFYDIFVRSEIMDSINQQNQDFMDQLMDDINKLEDVKVQLGEKKKQQENDKAKLEADKITLEQQRDDLADDKTALDERVKYFNDLNSEYWGKYNTYSAQIQDLKDRQASLQYEKKVTQADREKAEKALEEEIRQAQLRAQRNTVYDTGEWAWPLDLHFHLITTYFGYDDWRKGNHGGIDIGNAGIMGANIYASKGGEVIVAKTTYIPGYDYGMYVVIDHGDGYQTLYAHCSAIYVSVGQVVNKGDCIAAVGSTGWATGPHLHFEVRKDGARQDPFNYVTLPTV